MRRGQGGNFVTHVGKGLGLPHESVTIHDIPDISMTPLTLPHTQHKDATVYNAEERMFVICSHVPSFIPKVLFFIKQ